MIDQKNELRVFWSRIKLKLIQKLFVDQLNLEFNILDTYVLKDARTCKIIL